MSDRMAAEIWIGGKLPRSLLESFPIDDLSLDWDNSRLASSAEADILAARDDGGLLHLADIEAAWGEFQELEAWLREHNMPFRRQSEGKYEHSPEIVEFRPDLKRKKSRDVCITASHDGKPIVLAAAVQAIADRMAKLKADRRSETKRLQVWEKLLRKLVRILPPQLPPLPKFEIVDG